MTSVESSWNINILVFGLLQLAHILRGLIFLPQVSFTMNSVLQSAFLCCVLSTLLPKITSANPLNADDLRR